MSIALLIWDCAAGTQAKSAARPQLLRPSDLVALSHSALASPASSPPQPPRPEHQHARTPSAIEKYTEHDEDDYDEVFADGASWGRSGVGASPASLFTCATIGVRVLIRYSLARRDGREPQAQLEVVEPVVGASPSPHLPSSPPLLEH